MKKSLIVIIIIVVIVGAIVGYVLYNNHQKRVSICKESCSYYPAGKSWGIPSTNKEGKYIAPKYFETQEQCIDYCLIK